MPMFSVFRHLSCHLVSGHILFHQVSPSQLSSGFWPYPLSPGLTISVVIWFLAISSFTRSPHLSRHLVSGHILFHQVSPSQSSSGFWPYPLSPGLPISVVIWFLAVSSFTRSPHLSCHLVSGRILFHQVSPSQSSSGFRPYPLSPGLTISVVIWFLAISSFTRSHHLSCHLVSGRILFHQVSPSQLSSGFWPYPLSPGLPISVVIWFLAVSSFTRSHHLSCHLVSGRILFHQVSPSQLSSGFWPYPLSPGLPISVVIWFQSISSFTRSPHLSFGLPRFRFPSTFICNIFLVASSLSRPCTCPNHLNLFSLRNSAIGYMCASFQMSTFLT